MNDIKSAKIGQQNQFKSDEKFMKFWGELGFLLAEMRKKRNQSQEDFSVPSRTIRRIEKGGEPHISYIEYAHEMKPCLRELARYLRLYADLMEPSCRKCDPECMMYGKTHEQLLNTIRHVVGLIPK